MANVLAKPEGLTDRQWLFCLEYIKDLNEAYNYFFFRYKSAPLLIINATEIDFVNEPEDFEDLMTQIMRKDKAPVEYYNPKSRNKS